MDRVDGLHPPFLLKTGMVEWVFITLAGQIFMPLALAVSLWRAVYRRRLEWFLHTLAVSAYLALIFVAGVWLLVPRCMLYVFVLLSSAAAVGSWRRCSRSRPPVDGRSRRRLRPFTVYFVMAVFCVGNLSWALSGYRPPTVIPTIDLASPLKNGMFFVVNGGYSILINPHMKTLQRQSLAKYRAQSYALDIIKIDGLGRRADAWWPTDLNQYHIFGEPVFAPCSGVVAQIEERLPDQASAAGDELHPAGNFVLLECADASILLAHLMQSSIAVRAGDQIQVGDLIGRVGNSGMSIEPHLHLHAQRRAGPVSFLSSEPLPFRIEGRTLVRNDRLEPH